MRAKMRDRVRLAALKKTNREQTRAKRKIHLRCCTGRANLTSRMGKNKMSCASPHESSLVGCSRESFVQVSANI
jgi:hypothetical protein